MESQHRQKSVNLRSKQEDNLGDGDKSLALHYFEGRCCYCNVELVRESGSDNSVEFDHYQSLAQQYFEDPELVLDGTIQNRVPSCRKCNRNKSDHQVDSWLERTFPKRKNRIIEKIEIYFALQEETLFR